MVEAPAPMPFCAKTFQIAAGVAPPKRVLSAASIASRASSIDVEPSCSKNASNISWIQRRPPGHCSGGSGEEVADWPSAQRSCSDLLDSGKEPLYFETSWRRTLNIAALHTSPSACTSGPVTSYP